MPIDVGLPRIPVFKGRLTATQTVTTALQWTPVALNNQRFYAPRPCTVLVSGAVMFDTGQGTTNPRRVAAIYKNSGSVEVDGSTAWGIYPNDYFTIALPIIPVDMATNDYLELQVYSTLASTKLFGNATSGAVMTVWEAP